MIRQDLKLQRCSSFGPLSGWPGRALFLLAVCALLAAQPSVADRRPEIQIKAAFLVNFARYVEWPPDAFFSIGSALVVGILADEVFFESARETMSGKTVDNRAVEMRSFDDVSEVQGVHILFIGRSQKKNADALRRALAGRAVFAIADFEGFAADGGVADFFFNHGKVRFTVNPKTARAKGLKISSKLLRVAKIAE